MVSEPQRAIDEIARCLKPGGKVIGTAFFSGGSRRAHWIFGAGARRGHTLPPDREQVADWLLAAGLTEPKLGRQPTFAAFSADKPPAPQGEQTSTLRGAKIT
jgi:ubiquinone/menaquinone biosynthesis C-methylase UbiE